MNQPSEGLEALVRRLADKDAIVDLVHRYSFYVDHGRMHELVDLFTPDCVMDYGPGIGVFQGQGQLLDFLHGGAAGLEAGGVSGFTATSHQNANVIIDFTGSDEARVNSSLYAWHGSPAGPNPRIWGYYRDTVVRQADSWLFARRRLVVAGHEDFPVPMNPFIEPDQP